MRIDQSQRMTTDVMVAPAVLAADPTPITFDIGLAGAATILLQVGVGGITFTTVNKIEFVLSHSDTEGSGYEPVEQDDVVGVTVTGSGIVRSLVAAHAAASVTRIGYRGGKRYLQLLPDFSGTHATGTPIAAVGVRGELERIAQA